MFPCLCAQGSSIAEYLDFSRIAVKRDTCVLVCLYALRGFTRPSYISTGGGATWRLAAIMGATPTTSIEREGQVIKLAMAMTLYIVGLWGDLRDLRRERGSSGRVRRPMLEPMRPICKLLEAFQGVASMDKLDLDKFVFTNYNLSSLKPGCQAEEGTK